MNEGSNKNLAAKIAKLLESQSGSADLTALHHSIEKLNNRLDRLESKLETPAPVITTVSSHPSQDKFAVIEAIVDEVFSQYAEEKACTFEPNGKPCDHCSMCSSRGF